MLVLINGQAGAGKSTVAQALLEKLEAAALIPADEEVSAAFAEDDWLAQLALVNLHVMLRSHLQDEYRFVIVDGLLRSQALLDAFLETLEVADCRVLYAWLYAGEDARRARRRAQGKKEQPRFAERVAQELKGPLKVKGGRFIALDTTKLSAEETAQRILREMM